MDDLLPRWCVAATSLKRVTVAMLTLAAFAGAVSMMVMNRSEHAKPANLCLEVNLAPENISISKRAKKGYISDSANRHLLVFSTETDALLPPVPLPATSRHVIAPGDGSTVYALLDEADPSLAIIAAATDRIVDVIPLPISRAGTVIVDDARRIGYVTTRDGPLLIAADFGTRTAMPLLTTSDEPEAHTNQVALSPDKMTMYVTTTEYGGDTVSVVDVATNKLTTSIKLENAFSDGLTITPDGHKALVAILGKRGSIAVLDLDKASVEAKIAVGPHPQEIAVTTNGSKAYVSNHLARPGSISVLDLASMNVVDTILVEGTVGRLALGPEDDKLYVLTADSDGAYLDIVSLSSKVLRSRLPLAPPEKFHSNLSMGNTCAR